MAANCKIAFSPKNPALNFVKVSLINTNPHIPYSPNATQHRGFNWIQTKLQFMENEAQVCLETYTVYAVKDRTTTRHSKGFSLRGQHKFRANRCEVSVQTELGNFWTI